MNDSMEYWFGVAEEADFWFNFYFFRKSPLDMEKMDAILEKKREAYENILRIAKDAMGLPTNEGSE